MPPFDPLGLVLSLNVQRRDLTAAQRAIVAARVLPVFEAEAKKRQTSGKVQAKGRRAADDAAIIFKVSRPAVQQAKAILIEAPDLAAQVEACALCLADAYGQLQARKAEAEAARGRKRGLARGGP